MPWIFFVFLVSVSCGKEWRVKPPHLSAALPPLSVDLGESTPIPSLTSDLEPDEPPRASGFSPMT